MIDIVKPHRKISRRVDAVDVPRVLIEAEHMMYFFEKDRGCVAIAHPQVEENDPLRFFVLLGGQVIVNPEITNHVKYTVDSPEGCLTFPEKEITVKQRWRKIEVSYETIGKDGELIRNNKGIMGFEAFVFQHETDHLNGKYCYDCE